MVPERYKRGLYPRKQLTDLSIVIVNYNTPDYTAKCVDSVLQNPPSASYEIVLVDNASSDASADRLAQRYPTIKIIYSPKNTGIAGGNNLGIRASEGRRILLLNNDTIVLPGVLDSAMRFLDQHPEAGGVGGRLVNPDGTFQSSYVDFATLSQLFLITTKLGTLISSHYPSHGPSDKTQEVDWISTAFMLFRRDALDGVGLVDEEYFIYSDEPDLQYRLKRAGWKIFYSPDLQTIHYGGKSLTPWKRRRMVYRGYLLFFSKHRSIADHLLLRAMFAVTSALKLPLWAFAWTFPKWRARASEEWSADLDVLRMSIRPGIPSAY